jgi:flagellar basal-body rod protein FlgC
MDYSSAFAISAAGMEVQRTRLDVAAINIANVNTTKSIHGGPYVPLIAVTRNKKTFFEGLKQLGQLSSIPQATVLQESNNVPRLVFEPSHPDANSEGFVAYPGVDTVTEMVNLMTAVRSYEANVVALNAAKSMALKAIDLGSGS